jgi:UDP-N-acetylglucosamine--N-acetylmuramyl-(pentapeptide) pyrophosphoryl-undecaprenol N-acetylglucosamine transferase
VGRRRAARDSLFCTAAKVSPQRPLSRHIPVYIRLMRAILAGGGTGGHVIPALAIAQELKKDYAAEVLFVGTARGIENRLVPAAGFPLQLIEVGALKNVSITTRLKTTLDLPRAIWRAWRMLAEYRPGVVIGVGGYASGPMMLAAALSGTPTLAFEPNVVPGFANRLVAPMVTAAAVHFEETCRYFRRCQVTGVPVREAFFKVPASEMTQACTLLVFGGSQGAHAINQVILDSLPHLCEKLPQLHIIHQTGERDYNDAKSIYERSGASAEVYRFIDDMPAMFAQANLVLCRSGASTVAEVTAAGKPAIFVPFPRAADDHQTFNARALERAAAAIVLQEAKLTSERLIDTITSLVKDCGRLKKMGLEARKLSHPNAAGEIAEMAARLAQPSGH